MTQSHTSKCKKRQLGIWILTVIVEVVDLDDAQNEFAGSTDNQTCRRRPKILYLCRPLAA